MKTVNGLLEVYQAFPWVRPCDMKHTDFVLYTNYFGMDDYIDGLREKPRKRENDRGRIFINPQQIYSVENGTVEDLDDNEYCYCRIVTMCDSVYWLADWWQYIDSEDEETE